METTPKKPKRKLIITIVSIALIGVITAGYITTVSASNLKEEDVLLREYSVSRGDITAGIDGTGALVLEGKPHNFNQSVKIEELLVKVGDRVKKGDKLAKMDIEALNKKIGELETQLKKAKVNLKDAKNNKNISNVEMRNIGNNGDVEYENQHAKAKGATDNLATNINALTARSTELEGLMADIITQITAIDGQIASLPENDPTLVSLTEQKNALTAKHAEYLAEHQGIAPKLSELNAQYNDAVGNLQGIEQSYANSQALKEKENAKQKEVNSLKQQGLDNSIELVNIEIQTLENQIEELNEAKKEPYLIADTDGIVLDLSYSEGMDTTGEKAVATIGAPKDIYARVQVAQTDIGNIEEGQEAELTFDTFPERKFKGKVIKKLPMPVKDSNPVAYIVHVSVDMEGEDLLIGMTASVQFIAKQVKDVIMLSNKAIKSIEGKQTVIMKDAEGKTFEKTIETGFSDGRYSEIITGLKEGDVVYVEG